MKNSIFIIAFVFLFTFTTGNVLAQTVTSEPTDEPTTSEPTVSVVPTHVVASEEKLAKLKNKATKEINRRIAKLNMVLKLIDKIKNLTESQKSTLTTQVHAEIDKLNASQAKISGASDLATLKAEIKSLDNSYKAFALYVPKIQIIAKADKVLATVEKLSDLATKLEGTDAATDAILADMKKQLADAKTSAQAAIDAVIPLTPGEHSSNKTSLQNARKLLQAAQTSLKAANKDAKQLRKESKDHHGSPRPTRADKEHKELRPTRSPKPTHQPRPTHLP
jgi:hypothetical protein